MAYASWSVVFGEQPSAAKWNILGANDASFNDGSGIASLTAGGVTNITNSYKYLVRRITSNQSLTGGIGTATKLEFNSEVYDTGGNYDSATNHRFIAPEAGFYFFFAYLTISSGAGDNSHFEWYKNGSTHAVFGEAHANETANLGHGGSIVLSLAANDYIEIFFVNTDAGARDLVAGTTPFGSYSGGFYLASA